VTGLLATWLFRAAAILVVSYLGVGVSVRGVGAAVLAAVVLSLVDLVVRPLLILLTLPVSVLTFGLFIFVVNGIMLLIVGALVPGFTVRGVGAAVVASILIGIVGTALQWAFRLL
jgi:putative membrane protein